MARRDPVHDLVKSYKISEQQLKEKCSYDLHRGLDKKLTRWRNLAPHLFADEQVSKNAVDAIDHDERLDDEGKRHQLLERWKEACGSEATHEKLIRAFLSAERRDLAEFVCQELEKLTGDN